MRILSQTEQILSTLNQSKPIQIDSFKNKGGRNERL